MTHAREDPTRSALVRRKRERGTAIVDLASDKAHLAGAASSGLAAVRDAQARTERRAEESLIGIARDLVRGSLDTDPEHLALQRIEDLVAEAANVIDRP